MAPNLIGANSLFISEATTSVESIELLNKTQAVQQRVVRPPSKEPQYKWDIVWRNVIGLAYLHIAAFYGLYQFLFICKWKTFMFALFIIAMAGISITAGAHRLWAHRCYKAKLPLRMWLAFWQTVAFQNDLHEWVRDHRVHHKFTDTDADPHNANRGFFFSHVGWLLVRKHKEVFIKGKTVDLSDILADPVVQFQKKYYAILLPICCFLLPTIIPWYFWNEKAWVSWYVAVIFRLTFMLNGTWLVNSAAHIYGTKPFDKTIGPTENEFVASIAFGEGWHNYHHVFPWDYRASELGYYRNGTSRLIDWFASKGWAYDLKTVPQDMINKRVNRTGDGTRSRKNREESKLADHHHVEGGLWGWGDRDMTEDDINDAQVLNKID